MGACSRFDDVDGAESELLQTLLHMPIIKAAFARPGRHSGDRRPHTLKAFLRRWFVGRTSHSFADVRRNSAELQLNLSNIKASDELVGTAAIIAMAKDPAF